MDKKMIKTRMNGLIKVIERSLLDEGIQTERINSGVNPDIDILTCQFNTGINDEPVLSNTYFLPVPPAKEGELEPDMLYLVHSVTMRDDLEGDEQKLTMLQALNYINYYVPYGTFIMNDTLDTVTYRNLIRVYEALDDADATMFIFREIESTDAVAGLYVSAINALADNRITWDEFIQIVSAYTQKQ